MSVGPHRPLFPSSVSITEPFLSATAQAQENPDGAVEGTARVTEPVLCAPAARLATERLVDNTRSSASPVAWASARPAEAAWT